MKVAEIKAHWEKIAKEAKEMYESDMNKGLHEYDARKRAFKHLTTNGFTEEFAELEMEDW